MIDEVALKAANDRQTEKAFSITNALYDLGYPSAVSGGCARRYVGWCEWMNDADMLTTAPNSVVRKVVEHHSIHVLSESKDMVAGYDADGLYEICCWQEHGEDTSVFSHYVMNWWFEHRALALDARTREIIKQPGGVQNLKEVRARIDPDWFFSNEPYMCYHALSYACREDLPFDEHLMTLMRQKPHVNFFMGLFFKMLAKVMIGKTPSKGLDRLLEANFLYYLPRLQEAWRSASDSLREAIDGCSDWIQPWILLLREYPYIRHDLFNIYFPEQWLTYYERQPCIVFTSLNNDREKSSWTYWQVRKMMMGLANPPEYIRRSPRLSDRSTPFPFP